MQSLKTAHEFTELSEEVTAHLTEIGDASKTATEAQKVDLEFLAKRITERFSDASEMADTDGDYDALHRLNEAVDGVRAEITRASLILDKLSNKSLTSHYDSASLTAVEH